MQWEELSALATCSYVVQQGVVHLLPLDKRQLVKGLLSNLPYLLQRVKYGPYSITQLKFYIGYCLVRKATLQNGRT